ncbi:MAG: enoyl-CoA hydratase/isomerase family protein [Gemmataceae bacterium]
MTELVTYTHRGPAAVITLNRADKRNALSRALIAGLAEAFDRAADDKQARCVILAGAGPTFCAGMDLTELQGTLNAAQDEIWNDALTLAKLFDRIYNLPKPTIALVHGPAVAGGAGLVSVCDLAIASGAAKFGYPEVRRGLVAAIVMPHLLRHVGERMARYLLITGEMIDAHEAQVSGLVNDVVPNDELWTRAEQVVNAIAEGGPHAIAQTKELLRQFSKQAMSVEEAARASAAPRLTDECKHGLAAFFAKQPVPWKNQP